MSEISNEDKALFAEAAMGVQKLPPLKRATGSDIRPPIPKKTAKANRFLLTQKPTEHIIQDYPIEPTIPVSAHESLFFQRYSLRKQDLKSLKKGEFSYNWQIDLHGLTELDAQKQLLSFVSQAMQNQAKHLLIVHGKGYHSDTDKPVLKNLVNQVLRSLPEVIAFSSAQPKDGGTGATYVFLKVER